MSRDDDSSQDVSRHEGQKQKGFFQGGWEGGAQRKQTTATFPLLQPLESHTFTPRALAGLCQQLLPGAGDATPGFPWMVW